LKSISREYFQLIIAIEQEKTHDKLRSVGFIEGRFK